MQTDTHTFTSNGVAYDVRKLFSVLKHYPVTKVPMSELISELKENCWSDEINDPERKLPNFSPMDVANNWLAEPKYLHHYRKAIQSDLKYPIIVMQENNLVVDGMHRLLKAHLQNLPSIDVIYLDELPTSARLNP